MIIASSVMGIAEDPFTKTFTVAIQLGAILSVVTLYWKKFIPAPIGDNRFIEFYLKLLVAFIPTAVFGLLLHDFIEDLLGRVEVVGLTLVLGGIILLFIDRFFKSTSESGLSDVSYPVAFKIGLFQTLSMVPGVSRAAATIIGGLAQKLNRTAAAEFSFFLAVPTMFAATCYKLLKFFKSGNSFGSHEILLLVIGSAVAYFVALLAIRSFIGFLTRHGFVAFGYYRIAVGAIILLLYALGIELSLV
jgi:undecaprenyl-diphosphatase